MIRLEETILKNLINNDKFITEVSPFLKEEYFSDIGDKILFRQIMEFIDKYHTKPSLESIVIQINDDKSIDESKQNAVIDVLEQIYNDKEETPYDWLYDKTEQFCKDRAIYNAITKAIGIADGTDKLTPDAIPSLLQDALAISFNTDLGMDYLEDGESRYDSYHEKLDKIPFKSKTLNYITNNGQPRKTLRCYLSPSGCHAKGQQILMADGSIKLAENIVIGDKLMGDDGIRTVYELRRGRQKMAKITPIKGDPFVVNIDHILSLRNCSTMEVVDISVSDYLKKSDNFKKTHKQFRVGVASFLNSSVVPMDAWLLGVLLGDGCLGYNHITVSNNDEPVISKISDVIKKEFCIDVNVRNVNNKSCTIISFPINSVNGYQHSGYTNRFRDIIRDILKGSDSHTKFIPKVYLTSSIENRRNLLSGLLDTDGYLSNGCYEYVTVSDQLAEDILFLSRSLGLAAYSKKVAKKCQNGFEGFYNRICISGDFSTIPTVKHKPFTRKQIKNVLHTGFSVELLEEDDYYGWGVDGNRRYLMGDFTVTHNTGKSMAMCSDAADALEMGYNVVYFTMEMSEKKIAERIDANLMDIDISTLFSVNRNEFNSRIDKIKKKTRGKLLIKEYPTSSAHAGHFRQFLIEAKHKKKFIPDVIVIDYLGICASAKIKLGASTNSYTVLKSVAEEVRALCQEFNAVGITAVQANRNGYKNSDIDVTNTADSMGILHTLDLYLALTVDEGMEEAGEVLITQLKNRYGALTFKRFRMKMDRSRMRIEDNPDTLATIAEYKNRRDTANNSTKPIADDASEYIDSDTGEITMMHNKTKRDFNALSFE